MQMLSVLVISLSLICSEATVLRARSKANFEGYSFAQFVKDFNRNYKVGSAEYKNRESIFHQSLVQLQTRHADNVKNQRSWSVGVHPFMDWTQAERATLNGYKPERKHRGSALVTLQTRAKGSFRSTMNSSWSESSSFLAGPGMRNQGNCGSCWAISAVEAVEAQLQKSGTDVQLSAQALVDCVPNPQHCGGTGGCDGATGELAYSFMRDHGIPLEGDLPYNAETGSCPMAPLDGSWPAQSRARVDGWRALPSNQAEPLMQALVQDGPVVVAVDGNNWFDYSNGVFDGCSKDSILGHAVLAKGYGQEDGRKYWRIQNSWGAQWGEDGHIRLLQHDDENNWCGTDNKPQEGLGCDGGPPEITVCGTCGLLYDPIIPQGVRLEGGNPDMPTESSKADAAVTEVTSSPSTASDKDFDSLLRKFNSF